MGIRGKGKGEGEGENEVKLNLLLGGKIKMTTYFAAIICM